MTHVRIHKRLGATATLRPLGKWIWLAPALGVLLLGGGYALERMISTQMKLRLGTTLQTTLDANVSALEIWLASQKRFAGAIARADAVRAPIVRLESDVRTVGDLHGALGTSSELEKLRNLLDPFCEAEGFLGFTILDRSGRKIGDSDDHALGDRVSAEHAGLLERVLGGETIVTPPIMIVSTTRSDSGRKSSKWQRLFVVAPVRDASEEVIAALGLRIDPEAEFTGILGVSRPGASGETYAFDSRGVMISRSRFEDDLRRIGVLADDPTVHSTLNVELRDPGGDLAAGFVPLTERLRQPLTRMATAALAGRDGMDLEGYRNYRGVEVIGAWRWLADDGMGVAFETESDEAFAPVNRLRNLVWGLFGLLSGATLLILLATAVVSAIDHRMSDAVEEARKLGQYTLGDKIGSGGMGEVYRASHALLRRPTAIKLLRPERTGSKDIARFEREVQITAQLTHPNTVRIFDYGKTSDGVFYYAMEYLPGVSLDRLVSLTGPLPASRTIHILRQVCDSLREAHDHGLIHRDIKPANIILGERGGIEDVVKILDFGIVKALDGGDVQLTAADVMSGTPQYLSPEGIRTPANIDARADLYAVGAVGYFLLTGKVVFDGESVMDVCARQIKEPPIPPTERLGQPVPADLERLILHCLAKDREDRPASAAALYTALGSCEDADRWGREEAHRWRREHGARLFETGEAHGDDGRGVSGDSTLTRTLEIDPARIVRNP